MYNLYDIHNKINITRKDTVEHLAGTRVAMLAGIDRISSSVNCSVLLGYILHCAASYTCLLGQPDRVVGRALPGELFM